jgi:predicted nucleotidyltransferase
VEFKDPGQSPAKRFFGLLHSLEDALGCEVDLVTVNGLNNPYFRRRVLEERLPVYGRGIGVIYGFAIKKSK